VLGRHDRDQRDHDRWVAGVGTKRKKIGSCNAKKSALHSLAFSQSAPCRDQVLAAKGAPVPAPRPSSPRPRCRCSRRRDSSWAAVLMCCRCTNAALLLSSRCVAGRRIRHGTSARGRRSKLTAASGAAQPQATPLPPLRPQALQPQALQPHPPLPCIQGLVCRAFSWTISMSSA
jgi:hypothetical protein